MANRNSLGQVVRVAVATVESPEELAGGWCQCPRTGSATRVERCMGCEHAVELHRGGSEEPFILCRVEAVEAPEAATTAVSAIMTAAPLCVPPTLTLEKLLPLLVDANVGGVPVVDAAGHALGMVSKTDLLAEHADEADQDATDREFSPVGELLANLGPRSAAPSGLTAGDLMSSPLLTVAVTDSVARAADLMSSRYIHRLGVTDSDGRVVGVVTTLDIVRWLARASGSAP